jgi:hypothetical protein
VSHRESCSYRIQTQPWANVVTLGGASLLMGATKMAPSKDTLWTRSVQPPTSSDRTHAGVRRPTNDLVRSFYRKPRRFQQNALHTMGRVADRCCFVGPQYFSQPHVELDSILATLSLGPVGISDGLNETDASLIGQAFMSATDSTLLRPSRPLSVLQNRCIFHYWQLLFALHQSRGGNPA